MLSVSMNILLCLEIGIYISFFWVSKLIERLLSKKTLFCDQTFIRLPFSYHGRDTMFKRFKQLNHCVYTAQHIQIHSTRKSHMHTKCAYINIHIVTYQLNTEITVLVQKKYLDLEEPKIITSHFQWDH